MDGLHRSADGARQVTRTALIALTAAAFLTVAWTFFAGPADASKQRQSASEPECDPDPSVTANPQGIFPAGEDADPDFPNAGGQFVATVTISVDANSNGETCEPVEYVLASYDAQGPTLATSAPQSFHDSDALSTKQPGTYTLMADIPSCFWQVDFATGTTVVQPGSDGIPSYGARLVAAEIGGTACGPTTTTATTTTPGGTTTTTTPGGTTTTTTPGGTTTTTTPGGTTTTTTPGGTTTTTTPGDTTTTTTPGATTTTTATTSTTTPTSSTSTTSSTTIGPTTVRPTTTSPVTIGPTTVQPGGGGIAFTGIENVVPLGAIVLMLMTAGSGLLWAGSRRKGEDGSDEDRK
jgi:hypothetical protein